MDDRGCQESTLSPPRRLLFLLLLAAASTPRAETAGPATGSPFAAAAPGFMEMLFQDNAEQRRLVLAPIRWRGHMGLEHRFVKTDDGARSNQTIEFASVDMATFIAQPWLAQVRANLGIVASQERGDGLSGTRGQALGSGTGASLTGGGALSVFPASRFPFTASFETTDSRTSGEATASDYVSRTLALRQAYRSPLGDQVYGASFDRSTLISESFGRDTVTSLNGTLQRTFGLQSVDVSGNLARNRRSPGDDGSDLARLSARHSWRPGDTTTVDTFGSLSSTELVGAGRSGLRTRFLQLNSFGSWRPEEDHPLFLTGGVRLADASLEGSGASGSVRTLGANVAASYALTEHATLVGSAGVASIGADGASDIITNQSVAATYSPAPRKLGGFNYSWTTSATAANQTGGVEGGQHALGAQANHQLSRGFVLGRAASLTASVNQGLGVQDDSLRDVTQTLVHSGSLGLRVNPTAASDAFLGLNVGDSRSHGGREDHFQLANVQASGQLQLGPYSIATANFTLQAVRQRMEGDEAERTTVQRSGTLAYQHARLFGVRNLRYIASATFNELQLESRLLGDAAAPRDPYTRMFEQRLQYDIGRLDFRLGMRLATIDGRSERQFFFRVNRQFGLF